MKEISYQLCDKLDRIEYDVKEMAAAVGIVRKRIFTEWINEEPLKTYGNPPRVLSAPLTETQVKEMLSCYGNNLLSSSVTLHKVSEELLKGEQ